jgi:hypothetical protein
MFRPLQNDDTVRKAYRHLGKAMSQSKLLGALAGCLCAAALWPTLGLGAGKDTGIPQFGPDVVTAWAVAHADGDDYLPPKSGPGPVKFDPAHPFVPTDPAGSTQPTYRVADLTNPILKPWAVEQMRKANEDVLNGKVPYVPRERCWPAGVPAFVLEPPFNITVFIQTPKEVLIVHQQDQQVRRIFLNVPHSTHPKPSWTGESVGHYEGDELVVDTIGFNDRTFVDNYRTPHTDKMHVIERFKLLDGGNILEDRLTIEDPGAFNMVWSAVQRWRRTSRGPLEEISCAENNESFYNYDVRPVPQATKSDF